MEQCNCNKCEGGGPPKAARTRRSHRALNGPWPNDNPGPAPVPAPVGDLGGDGGHGGYDDGLVPEAPGPPPGAPVAIAPVLAPAGPPPPLVDPYGLARTDGSAAKRFAALRGPVYEGANMSSLEFLARTGRVRTSRHVTGGATDAFHRIMHDAVPPAMGRSPFLSRPQALEQYVRRHSVPGYKVLHMCPGPNTCVAFVNSPWVQWRQYENLDDCPVCRAPRWEALPPVGSKRPRPGVCRPGMGYKSTRTPAKTFLYLPLAELMASVYARPELVDALLPDLGGEYYQDEQTDIHHTRGWRERMREDPAFAREPRNLVMSLSADGVPLNREKKNKEYSMTVIMSTIQNLPPALRTLPDNVLLHGIIPGPSEPKNMQAYNGVLADDFITASRVGHTFVDARTSEQFLGRAMLLLLVADFKGLVLILGRGCSTGTFGCPWCMVKSTDLGGRRAFTVPAQARDDAPYRTRAQTTQLARQYAALPNDSQRKKFFAGCGVHRDCELDRVPGFDSHKDASVDNMHMTKVVVADHTMKAHGAKGEDRQAKRQSDPRVAEGWGPNCQEDLAPCKPDDHLGRLEREKEVIDRLGRVAKWAAKDAAQEAANAHANAHHHIDKEVRRVVDLRFHKLEGPTVLNPGLSRSPFQGAGELKCIDWLYFVEFTGRYLMHDALDTLAPGVKVAFNLVIDALAEVNARSVVATHGSVAGMARRVRRAIVAYQAAGAYGDLERYIYGHLLLHVPAQTYRWGPGSLRWM
jgi:hypothetical protein